MTNPDKADARGATSDEPACWRFGEVTFDERTLELKLRGELRPLAPKPLEILTVLLRRAGEVVTKDELFAAVWPRRIVSEASLTNAIGKLRAAIGDEQQQIIKLAHRHGYRLMGAVVRETPPAAAVAAPLLSFTPGQAVPLRPDWRLESRVGAGGQGEVWRAVHRSTGESRAFKFARDEASLIGLKREVTLFRLLRDSLGMRRDLAPLLDWNLEQAPCFVATQWCTGGSLADWAAMRGGLLQVPLPQRLELLAQTADALAATHAIGALHKDVKPGNVLIAFDDEDRPYIRLADFGSARLLARRHGTKPDLSGMGFTQTLGDSTSGTPLYLAPELIAGQVATPQSDIYSLGVMLYQLVVGDLRRSLAPGWERDVADPLLREDIALAAAGDPAQRLEDAAQLAQRLRGLEQRHVDLAREQQLMAETEAARRELERNLARRGLARALGVTLVAGLIATSVLLWQALRARGEARSEAARANAVTAFLSRDLLTAANPVVAGRRDVTVRELLDGAVRQMGARFGDQPQTYASLQVVIGSAYAAMGEREKAEPLLDAAVEALSALTGDASMETQSARVALRDMYLNLGVFEAALGMTIAIGKAEVAAGRPNPEFAVESEAMGTLASCWARYRNELVARCEEVARQQYAHVVRELGPDALGTARIGMTVATTLMRAGRAAEALPIMQDALAGQQRWMGADNLWLFQTENLLTEAMVGVGRFDEGLQRSQRALERATQIYGPDHRLARLQRRCIATARLGLGQAEAAATELDSLVAVLLESRATPSRELGLAVLELARAQMLRKRPADADAEAALRAVLPALKEKEPDGGYWTHRLRESLADARVAQQAHGEAETLYRQNLTDARRLFTQGEWVVGWSAYRLGAFLASQDRQDEAQPLLLEGVRELEQSLGADDPRTVQARAAV